MTSGRTAVNRLLFDADLYPGVIDEEKSIHVELITIALHQIFWNGTSDEHESNELVADIEARLRQLQILMERYGSNLSLENWIAHEYVNINQNLLVKENKDQAKIHLARMTTLLDAEKKNASRFEATLIDARIAALLAKFARTSNSVELTLGPTEVSDPYNTEMEADLRKRLDRIDKQLGEYAKIGVLPVLLTRLNKISLYAQTKCGDSEEQCREAIKESEQFDRVLKRVDAPSLLRQNFAFRIVLRTVLAEMTKDDKYLCMTFDVAEKAIQIPNTSTAFEDYKRIVETYYKAFSLGQLRNCAVAFEREFGRPMLDEDAMFSEFPKSTWKQ
jgi:hypothetical protein